MSSFFVAELVGQYALELDAVHLLEQPVVTDGGVLGVTPVAKPFSARSFNLQEAASQARWRGALLQVVEPGYCSTVAAARPAHRQGR